MQFIDALRIIEQGALWAYSHSRERFEANTKAALMLAREARLQLQELVAVREQLEQERAAGAELRAQLERLGEA